MIVHFCVVVLCLIRPAFGNKNSVDSNTRLEDFTLEEHPFRMQKVNLLWEKARKRLSVPKLADLYADLHVHDKHEAALKKYRVEGMDKDGLREAQVSLAFREIIDKFSLDDIFDPEGHLSNQIPQDEEKKFHFSDKKLQSMWKRAEQAGFTERDLQKLREEFWHQQMKIDEINFLKRNMNIEDRTDNELEDPSKTGKTAEELKASIQDLKVKHKDILAGFYNLEAKFSEFEQEEPEFRDHRVQHLWALAKRTAWSEQELESFKEELHHFEGRLKKHDFFEDQRVQSAQSLKDGDGHNEKHQALEQKARDIRFKVKKIHSDLKTKVTKAFSQHTEL